MPTHLLPDPRARFQVYSVRRTSSGATLWTLAGEAVVNKDGSLNVTLDVLPLDGRLHLRAVVRSPQEAPFAADARAAAPLPPGARE